MSSTPPTEGRRIKVKKAPASSTKISPLEYLATLCYYYPQYTLASARRLPFSHVRLLLKEAKRREAEHYLNLVQIATAPHTKKGDGVKKLINIYKDIATNA